MRMYHPGRTFLLCVIAFLIYGCDSADQSATPAALDQPPALDQTALDEPTLEQPTLEQPTLEQQVEGLWFYTGLTTSDGAEMPLTGIFLFKDGVFVQQSVFNGEPFEEQGAMAHAGPYLAGPEWVHLVAEQTISTAPLESSPLSFTANTEHDVAVSRSGDDLSIVFSKGTSTVQNFVYVGPGEGELYGIQNGVLAFVDGYFILVQGDESGAVTGYGTFEKDEDSLTLNIIRWAESDQSVASNLRDTTMQATFDGQLFTLEDGRSFQVTP